jgi:hypothetical protein
MRILIGVFSFCLFVILFSCEEHGFLVECAQCKVEEPKNAELEIQLSKPDQNMAGAKIDIYEGNLEDNILLDSFYEKTESFTYWVSLNKKYTITATYYMGAKYTAVNSVTPRVRYSKDQCDDPCYYVYNRTVNLKLKYTE